MWFCWTRNGKVALGWHVGLNERMSAKQGLAQGSVNTSLSRMHGDVFACDLIDSVMRVLQGLLCHHANLRTDERDTLPVTSKEPNRREGDVGGWVGGWVGAGGGSGIGIDVLRIRASAQIEARQ